MTDLKINTVTVIGATGSMGYNVAGIFASFGNAKVYMVGRNIEKVKATVARTVKSVRADSIEKNLFPADFSSLEACVSESDLIFESAVEDIDVKKEIACIVNKAMKPDAVSCTGSSGLPITELSKCYSPENRKRFFGLHMFNPPYSMSLCELICTGYTDQTIKEELTKYASETLYRTVVEVEDQPAFLGNRIGFMFINKALQYAEKYKDNGGIDYIDAILGPFSGRSMAPLVTSDFVGLDVHKAIVDNLYNNTDDYANQYYEFPVFANELVESGKLGRKTKQGLYKTIINDNGSRTSLVYDISSKQYREKMEYVFPFAEKMKKAIHVGDYAKAFSSLINNESAEAHICLEFLADYILYSAFCAAQIGHSMRSADDVMATGFNICPPFALADAFSQITDLKALLMRAVDKQILQKIDVSALCDSIEPSAYDFRPFFRSKRS